MQYATRAIIKCLRYIKLRSLHGHPSDMVLCRVHNPLKVDVQVVPSHAWTSAFLSAYRTPVDTSHDTREPSVWAKWFVSCTHPFTRVFCDSISQGWVAWRRVVTLYKPPDKSNSTFQPWEKSSEDAVECLRNIVTNPSFWQELSKSYAEEEHKEVIDLDNVACIKSICMFV
jgi:proteasome activator subunit 4